MKIEKIIVRDFRSHEFTKVTFTSGINLIIGQNGSGKSSLLDAILVGLYWPTRPKDLKKDNFLRVNGKSTEITIFFEKDGVKYQVHRNITRNIAFAKYYDNGTWHHLTEANHISVKNWVEKLIPYDIFVNAIYIRQGEIDAILESDESREKVVRKVLGLDKYENAYKNLLEVRKVIESKIKGIEEYLNAMKNIDDMIKEYKNNLNNVIKEIEEISPQIPKIRNEIDALRKKLEKLDKIAKDIENLKEKKSEIEKTLERIDTRIKSLTTSIAERESKVKDLEEKVKELEKIKDDAEKYIELEKFYKEYSEIKSKADKEIRGYEGQISQIKERLNELERKANELKELQEKISEIDKEIKELEEYVKQYEEYLRIKNTIESLRKRLSLDEDNLKELKSEIEKAKLRKEEILNEIREIEKRKGELENAIREKRKAILELRKAKGKCPVCGSELTEEHRQELIKKYNLEIENYEKELKHLHNREQNLRAEQVRIEKILKKEKIVIANEEILNQIKENEEKLSKYNLEELEKKFNKYNNLSTEKNKLEGRLKSIHDELRNKNILEERKTNLERKIYEIKNNLQKYDVKLKNLGFENIETLKDEIERLKSIYEKYIKLSDSVKELIKEKNLLENEINELNSLKKKKFDVENELNEVKEKLENLENSYSKEEHEKVRSEYIEKRESLREAETELKNLEKRKGELTKNLDKLKNEKKNVEIKKKELENLKKVKEKVQELREKVRKFKNILKEDALAKVGEYASEIFEELTEEKYSNVTVKAKDNKVVLGIVYDGKERDLSFLSCGERIALGLAFRLALSLYLAGEIPLLIMDEPTPYLDDERRRRLVDIMERYLKKIPQVIIVSHDEELKDAADKVVRIRLENGVSKVEEVEVC
ncbi:DNA double-strand break repair Rad50 ATPase [Methanocaldococcus lauensis]|uniref:DNA double-strand break repair Rad50 ATPase n=1 Tax=Methanocaldococcus lauensis TaxID=2546128 RepID=A0A8D6SV25_9EURY|nr:DNA double-strand break repair ATPase Rad50 [Methanocaldococcus lauensis]CAB3289222.1 DNA double-strand break repair Rad50 ATPase [Methanocaldococcus lauensis]